MYQECAGRAISPARVIGTLTVVWCCPDARLQASGFRKPHPDHLHRHRQNLKTFVVWDQGFPQALPWRLWHLPLSDRFVTLPQVISRPTDRGRAHSYSQARGSVAGVGNSGSPYDKTKLHSASRIRSIAGAGPRGRQNVKWTGSKRYGNLQLELGRLHRQLKPLMPVLQQSPFCSAAATRLRQSTAAESQLPTRPHRD